MATVLEQNGHKLQSALSVFCKSATQNSPIL